MKSSSLMDTGRGWTDVEISQESVPQGIVIWLFWQFFGNLHLQDLPSFTWLRMSRLYVKKKKKEKTVSGNQSWPSNNTGLNCLGPFIWELFFNNRQSALISPGFSFYRFSQQWIKNSIFNLWLGIHVEDSFKLYMDFWLSKRSVLLTPCCSRVKCI